MRVLIDECLPRQLSAALIGFEARTVPETGWAGKSNGELLALAESVFDVFVTIDKNLVHQQSLTGRRLAIVVLAAPSSRFDSLMPPLPKLVEALNAVAPGAVVRVAP
jgi:predicted nuclease of predicted toxin-antitoxin system